MRRCWQRTRPSNWHGEISRRYAAAARFGAKAVLGGQCLISTTLDAEGRILYANDSVSRLLQRPKEEITGRTIWEKHLGERHGWLWKRGDSTLRWSGGPAVQGDLLVVGIARQAALGEADDLDADKNERNHD